MRPKRNKDFEYERLLAQERLILDATEAIVGLLDEQCISRQELAARLGKSKGFVSQLLSGERNMTLRTLADLGHSLGRSFSIVPSQSSSAVLDTDAVRGLFAGLSTTAAATHWISPAKVDERLRAAEDFSVDVSDYHEYGLAA